MKKLIPQNGFLFLLFVVNLGLAAYATPMTAADDAGTYLMLSQSFLRGVYGSALAHHSPFYSIVLAGFMLLFKAPLLYKIVVFFQYGLVACTCWMTYNLFKRLFLNNKWAMVSALLFNLSFATIYFANLTQTEILTVFFLVLTITLLIKIYEKVKLLHCVIYGMMIGLLSLTRFNTVPLIFTFSILLGIALFRQEISVPKKILSFSAFILPYLLIINAWCLYNQIHSGFYGLFPLSGQGGVSRNIIVASIRPEDTVSAAEQPILHIFNKARETFLQEPKTRDKGSLKEFDKYNIILDLYSGFSIYEEARPSLVRHFNLPDSSGEYEVSKKLAPFYQEILKQNKEFILKSRFLSLLSSFRPSTGSALPAEYGNINLNILPAFLFTAYRIAFIFMSLVVFFAFFFFVIKGMKKGWDFEFTLLVMFLIIFSFWGINFAYITAGDADRFKFPADPFIIGLFVYYSLYVLNWMKKKWNLERKTSENKI